MSDPDTNILNNSTRLMNPVTMEYNLTVPAIKARERNIIWGLVTESVMAQLGYVIVHPTSRPEGDVVYEIEPKYENERFYQNWFVRGFTEAEKRIKVLSKAEELLQTLDNNLNETMRRGYPFNFGTEEAPNYQHIQIRTTDRANHAGMASKNTRSPDRNQVFRSFENNNFILTPEQVVEVTDAAYEGYVELLRKAWIAKDAIRIAQTQEQFPNVPSTLSEFYTKTLGWVWHESAVETA